MLQNHLEEFLRQFKWLLTSREWFEDWKRQIKAGGLTDIQRAARYYYLQRNSFAGKVRGRTFGTGPENLPGINLLRMEEELSAVHLRLARVTIENLAWDDFVQMAVVLEGLKGKFILSINDAPDVRELYGAFTIEPVNLTYRVARKGSTPAAELLVRNFLWPPMRALEQADFKLFSQRSE